MRPLTITLAFACAAVACEPEEPRTPAASERVAAPLPPAPPPPAPLVPAPPPTLPDPLVAPPREDLEGAVTRCDAGDREGCFEAGRLAYEGFGVPRDSAKAVDYASRACSAGHARACLLASRVLRGQGKPLGDSTRAIELAHRACELDLSDGCLMDARLASELGFLGRAAPKTALDRVTADPDGLRHVADAACDADDIEACLLVGLLRAGPMPDAASVVGAVSVLRARCDGGNAAACAGAKGLLELADEVKELEAGHDERYQQWEEIVKQLERAGRDACDRRRHLCGLPVAQHLFQGLTGDLGPLLPYAWIACVSERQFEICGALQGRPGDHREAWATVSAEACLHGEDLAGLYGCVDAVTDLSRIDPKKADFLFRRANAFMSADCAKWAPEAQGGEGWQACERLSAFVVSGRAISLSPKRALRAFEALCRDQFVKSATACGAADKLRKQLRLPPPVVKRKD